MNHKPTLYMLCGLPGSGKTTLAKKLAVEYHALELRPDDWLNDLGVGLRNDEIREKLETRFKALAYELLALGQSVILEPGFWKRKERDEVREAARKTGGRVELHYLDVPVDELWRRIEARGQSSDSWAKVKITRAELDEWASVLEVPDAEELSKYDNQT